MKRKISLKYVYLALLFLLLNCKDKSTLPDPLEAGWNGKPVCKVLEDNETLRILKCTFPPGVGHEKHYHKPHFGYTVAGSRFKITDTSGTRDVNVPAGYSFKNDDISAHDVLNIGDSTAIFLILEYK